MFEDFKIAFAQWESDYRANSHDYMTTPEMFATPEDELAFGRANHFLALLKGINADSYTS